MKVILTLLTLSIVFCGKGQIAKAPTLLTPRTFEDNYQYFKSKFEKTSLPFSLDSASLLSGEVFKVTEDSFNYTSSYISFSLLEKYLIDTTDTSITINNWYRDNKQFMYEEWSWFDLHYGKHFSTHGFDYFIIYQYNQFSAVNGGEWDIWLYTFENEQRISVEHLGHEEVFTSTNMKDDDEGYYWQRYYNIETTKLDFSCTRDKHINIERIAYSITKFEGDLLDEQHQLLRQKKAYLDADSVFWQIHPSTKTAWSLP